ncbi:MAG: 5-(carboxyamino)imidazole ribonucleotide synthase [Spirochaetota bacterium]
MAEHRAQVLVLGGGQLGRMLGAAAARLDIGLTVLDPTADCPAAATAQRHVTAPFTDFEAVVAAGRQADVVTVEIEHVSTDALRELERLGIPTRPSARVLEIINDKLAQRRRLADAGVPGPRFAALPDRGDTAGAAAAFGLPAVQKLRFGGYDGRGVAVVRAPGGSGLPLGGPSYMEELVEIETELSVLVARGADGAIATYPPVEMDMDPELNLVRSVFYPATVSSDVAAEADCVARAAAEAVDSVGITAVELFVRSGGRVLVNEIAPRPHNSGHLTIEAAETDQFEQHLRAVLGLPLGSTRMRGPAVMRNLIGTGPDGPVAYDGLEDVLAVDGVHLHLYGKRRSRAGRKMGHLTVCRPELDDARRAAARAVAALRVTGAGEGESSV